MARIGFVLADTRPAAVITTPENPALRGVAGRRLAMDRIDHLPAHDPGIAVRPGDLAYVIYTSGSTGTPKGVMIPHRAFANFLHGMRERNFLDVGDRLLAVTTAGFDMAVFELYAPLVTGATIVLAGKDVVRDAAKLPEVMSRNGITVLQATPSLWHAVLSESDADLRHLRALVGAEPLPVDVARLLRERTREVTNMYGPTETTVWSTTADLTGGDPSIGSPIANTQVYVLDSRLRLVPPGVAGELYIGGDGMARGYLEPGGPDVGTVRGEPVRARADVPHRRPGAVGPDWGAALPRARGRAGEGQRVPHRARRDRGCADRASGDRPRGRRRQGHLVRRQAAGRLRGARAATCSTGGAARTPQASGCPSTWCRRRSPCWTRCR